MSSQVTTDATAQLADVNTEGDKKFEDSKFDFDPNLAAT